MGLMGDLSSPQGSGWPKRLIGGHTDCWQVAPAFENSNCRPCHNGCHFTGWDDWLASIHASNMRVTQRVSAYGQVLEQLTAQRHGTNQLIQPIGCSLR